MLVTFGDFSLDLERRELRRDGMLVHTRGKVFDLLNFLIHNRGRVVGRDEVLEHI